MCASHAPPISVSELSAAAWPEASGVPGSKLVGCSGGAAPKPACSRGSSRASVRSEGFWCGAGRCGGGGHSWRSFNKISLRPAVSSWMMAVDSCWLNDLHPNRSGSRTLRRHRLQENMTCRWLNTGQQTLCLCTSQADEKNTRQWTCSNIWLLTAPLAVLQLWLQSRTPKDYMAESCHYG